MADFSREPARFGKRLLATASCRSLSLRGRWKQNRPFLTGLLVGYRGKIKLSSPHKLACSRLNRWPPFLTAALPSGPFGLPPSSSGQRQRACASAFLAVLAQDYSQPTSQTPR